MDSANSVHRADLRGVLVDIAAFLQRRGLLRVLFHGARLLRGVCDI